ncbi:hypothetical protein SUGI_0570290 [Cryptomeria japonica]|nr:hypothetical protein SUGI_0570290 [Cryptomeria japonica]
MYELCQTDKGVDVMRKKGVVIGNLWHSKRVTQLLSVSNLTISQLTCKSIKATREKLSSCYKTQRSILLRSLWNEFCNAYGSKLWLVVGGLGAPIVLCLTAIQVIAFQSRFGMSKFNEMRWLEERKAYLTLDWKPYEGKTLTLVQLKLDVDSEVYIRNLIAVEICSPDYKHRRMTAYCQFMYELCQTEKGVDVMREKGVIIGNLWHSKQDY